VQLRGAKESSPGGRSSTTGAVYGTVGRAPPGLGGEAVAVKDLILWLVYIYRDAITEAHLTPSEEEAKRIFESAKLKGTTAAIAKVVEVYFSQDDLP
jgi:hypothetical protein